MDKKDGNGDEAGGPQNFPDMNEETYLEFLSKMGYANLENDADKKLGVELHEILESKLTKKNVLTLMC